MSELAPTATEYREWRGTTLGSVTERVERDLVLELAGQLADRRLLDAGCGDGTYAIAAAERGASVTGIDIAEPMLDAARQRAAEHHVDVRLERADVRSLPFDDESFDVVLAVTVLCFVGDADAAVREMARVLAPGGRLVVGELSRFSVWAAWRRVRGWLGSRTWRHATFRSGKELAQLLRSAGLEVERVAGAVYYPPFGLAASALAPIERVARVITTVGAAFVAASASKPARPAARGGGR